MRTFFSLKSVLKRFFKARQFGFLLIRRSKFSIPQEILILGKKIRLFYPTDEGVKNDFLTCLIEDEYGIEALPIDLETILDIGSNVGFFALAARARFPKAEIHAYEPNPRTFEALIKNCSSLQINCFQEAVGTTDAWVALDDSGDSNQTKTLTSHQPSEIVQISFKNAVERFNKSIDLAKIDCEGAEWDLFLDINSWKKIKNLRMEYHLWGKHSYQEVEAHLSRLGFNITAHHSSGEWGTIWAKSVDLPS